MSDEPKVTRTPTKLRTHFARRAVAWSMRLTRLALYFMFVAGVLALVAGRIAYAKAKQAALDMGAELVRLTDAGHLSGVNRLRINGELVKISSAVSQQNHQLILDRFQKECEDHADGIADEFATIGTSLDAAPKNSGFPGVGVLRKDDDTGGVVVCFAIGKAAGEAETFGRIAAFAKSGNLGDIGGVRYLMVKKGDNAPSHVVALWTEGSLDVNKMFPDQGDAPGNDAPGVLRPPSSRRLMTAYAEGAPYGVRVYESTMARDAVLAEYDRVMPATGWMVYPRAVEALPYSRAFSKEGHDIIVTAEPAATGTTVSIVEMGSK